MKRFVLILSFLVGVLTLNGANPVKLVKGDKSVFYQESAAYVVIDDHTTLIDGKNEKADVYYGNKSQKAYEEFVDDVDRGHASFITYFNEKRANRIKMTMSDTDEDTNYTLTVKVISMNVGNAGGMVWGLSRKAGGALINGTMQLIDKSTQKVVCEFEFEKVKGLLSPDFRVRVISVYRYLADGLLKAVQ